MERDWRLDYPFKRFSIVETPAFFTTYPRAWTQSQETMQPGIAYFPENGYTFFSYDFAKQIENNIKWMTQSGREITERDATVNAFMNVLWTFFNAESNMVMINNDKVTVNNNANPYYAYAQFFNFSYNIYSTEWTFVNRLIEAYLQIAGEQNMFRNSWLRNYAGLTFEEKVNIVIQDKSFVELLSDQNYLSLVQSLVRLNVLELLASVEVVYGLEETREYVFDYVKNRPFVNISFEEFLDSLNVLSGVDFEPIMSGWDKPKSLPSYNFSLPTVTKIDYRGDQLYQLEIIAANLSDVEGIVTFQIPSMRSQSTMTGDQAARWNVKLGPGETKRIIRQWPESPRTLDVNTLMS
ncbi:MAG: hypothetical protein LUF90_02575 [Rikenellaceae bacterium]|nr:hypothetical protein [Rikenellaceae bacterium]